MNTPCRISNMWHASLLQAHSYAPPLYWNGEREKESKGLQNAHSFSLGNPWKYPTWMACNRRTGRRCWLSLCCFRLEQPKFLEHDLPLRRSCLSLLIYIHILRTPRVDLHRFVSAMTANISVWHISAMTLLFRQELKILIFRSWTKGSQLFAVALGRHPTICTE